MFYIDICSKNFIVFVVNVTILNIFFLNLKTNLIYINFMQIENNEKIFLVVNLSYFGDVLLTNALCQNIKLNYPNSKVVFLVDKSFKDAAINQECVDEVIVFDKRNKHKGFLGLLKFVFSCQYRNKIYASFVMYDNDRGNLITFFLGSKLRIAGGINFSKFFVNKKFSCSGKYVHMQDINASFITALTNQEPKILPIKYNTNLANDIVVNSLLSKYKDKEIIGLCTVSKNKEKDMPIETAIEIIDNYRSKGKIVLFLGAGQASEDYANELKRRGCVDFENLVNKTSISSLANVLTACSVLITVDTGTMHLACAVNTPVAVVFYKTDMITKWAPREFLYKSVIIKDNCSANNICILADNLVCKQDTYIKK